MILELTTYGFAAPPDLAEFARVTALFEVWTPSRSPEHVAVEIRRAPGQSTYRCRVRVETSTRIANVLALAGDPHDAVLRASSLLEQQLEDGPSDGVGASVAALVRGRR